jgi:hypothetical protein
MRFFGGKKSIIGTIILAFAATNYSIKQEALARWDVHGRPFEFNAGGYELVQQPGMGLRIQ